ncbi:MAG: SDR family oxidoreductase [Rhodospirillaceae bacterium]|jgi:NAD(P)-dependent dehydrogenase (short-subunit alcohol dehydrogenase family)|nr:SDR family oxidoreductase [Rhodospirillaceae bacterium]MBT5240926.1 SDR family oxidoreductase [Rhodospirillaceae bacterium]MBT6090877.1 SDR family oxidoreductase [Rhodospirillaceae bacterium]
MTDIHKTDQLAGKVVLITGGTSGLGRWTTLVTAAQGATVVYSGRNADGAAETERRLKEVSLEAEYLPHDVTKEDEWQSVIDAVMKRHGRLDGLVNNSGVSRLKPMDQLSLEDLEFLLSVNVDGMFLGTQHAFRVMQSRGGSIVNISALNALRGSPNSTGYGMAKAGTTHLARAAAIEGRKYGIRANAVHPGVLFEDGDKPSPGAISLFGEEGAQKFVQFNIDTTPLGRLGHPRDIGTAVAFLLSDASRHVTGAAVSVDGGRMAGEYLHHGIKSQK